MGIEQSCGHMHLSETDIKVCSFSFPLNAGLMNLEQLLRQFLISKETLSVRMLDDSQDPTPLLKEIRDDKTGTIIVDANITMSHIMLERVSLMMSSHLDTMGLMQEHFRILTVNVYIFFVRNACMSVPHQIQ